MNSNIAHDIEEKRLEALKKYEILDSEMEEIFDDVTELAAQICGTPIALISLVDSDRLWFKSKVGLSRPEAHRDIGFCSQAIQQDGLLVIKDAAHHPRFSNNPFVTSDPNIRFYAGAPLRTPCGYKLGTLCVIDTKPRDLTEQQYNTLVVLSKQVVDQFEMRMTQKRLEKDTELNLQLSQKKDDVLHTISHDLKGALSSIVGLSEMMVDCMDTMPSEDIRMMAENILKAGQSSVKLLNNVLEWSMAHGEQGSFEPARIQLKEVIDEVLDLVVVNFMQKAQTFQVNCPQGLAVMGDRQMIFSIFQNLLSNACKYTPENETIYVNIEIENDKAKIRVIDNGTGMNPEQLQSIREGQRAVSAKGTNGEKGTGFGLMLCREFVEKQNGRFEVNSQQDKGTEFSFTIPVS